MKVFLPLILWTLSAAAGPTVELAEERVEIGRPFRVEILFPDEGRTPRLETPPPFERGSWDIRSARSSPGMVQLEAAVFGVGRVTGPTLTLLLGEDRVAVRIPPVEILSTLPTDVSPGKVDMRPDPGPITYAPHRGSRRPWWLAAALLLAAVLVVLWRRRTPAPSPDTSPPPDPVSITRRALEELAAWDGWKRGLYRDWLFRWDHILRRHLAWYTTVPALERLPGEVLAGLDGALPPALLGRLEHAWRNSEAVKYGLAVPPPSLREELLAVLEAVVEALEAEDRDAVA